MAYTTTADIKTYLGITATTDDPLIGRLIDAASQAIDTYTDRSFAAEVGDRTYRYTSGGVLYVNDLVSVTSITNGDGTALDMASVTLAPPADTPKWMVISTGLTRGEITITGVWGYGAAVPADIVQACVRWAAYMYRQKDAQVYETTAIPDAGVITVPQGMPADVKILLDRYRRLVVA